MMRLVLVLLSLLALHAIKFELDDTTIVQPGTPKLIRTVPMYAPADAPEKGPPGNGESFVKVKLSFANADGTSDATGSIDIYLIHVDLYPTIGTKVDGGVQYCSDGHLQLDQSKPSYLHVATVDMSQKTSTAKFNIEVTGQYLLVLSSCNVRYDVAVTGLSTWMNPYGYLGGNNFGFLSFYGDMAVLYLVVGLVWFILNAVYFKEVFMLQNCIAGLIFLCMIEMAVWYFDYQNLNNTGIRHTSAIGFGIFMSSFRRAVSRMLVVAVSYGWGVVRPTLGKIQKKILQLGGAYFVSEFLLEMVVRFSHHAEVNKAVRLILAIPVSVFNAIFYYWIFVTLYRLKAQLVARQQDQKLGLYKRFTAVLVVSLVAATGYVAYEAYFASAKLAMTQWSHMWILDGGFEQVLYSLVLFCIAFLWRPSSNSRRYAYAQVGKNEEADYGDKELPEYAGNVGHRNVGYDSEEDGPEPKFAIGDDDDDIEEQKDELIGDVVSKLE